MYFIAEAALAENATAGLPNLYVSHDGGAPAFIATLARNDGSDGIAGAANDEIGPAITTAVVSPDGARLAFLSEASLTGYDNEQATPGECVGETGRCHELFVYDAETGKLVCASCNPSGARPTGGAMLGFRANDLADYRSRNLLDDGALFFDSWDALVPHASDGRENVYEYENGHVYAISDVAGGSEAFFMDASADGANVFFGTADQLLPEDTSNNVAVWDARVDGGFPVKLAPPPCDNGDQCKSPSAPQPAAFGVPASTTFSGPGNVVPSVTATATPKEKTAAQLRAERLAKAVRACRRDRSKKKRVACEKSARKRLGAAKATKANHASYDRRASR